MRPAPDPHKPNWRSRRDGPGWRHGLLLVLIDDVVDSWRVVVSVLHGETPSDRAMELVRTAFGLGDAAEEPTPIDGARFLVLPKLPESYPWDTTGVVFNRDSAESPWHLHSLFTGDSGHYQVHDAGWNSSSEANLYADVGGGGGLPYLHKLVPECIGNGLHATWSRHGWCDGGKLGHLPADPAAFGYLVLIELPNIALEERERLMYCETCEELQDGSENRTPCGHIWWCKAAEGWVGAIADPASESPCADEYCDCHDLEGTRRLYAVPLLWAHGRWW